MANELARINLAKSFSHRNRLVLPALIAYHVRETSQNCLTMSFDQF